MNDLIKRADAIKWFEPYADRGLKIPVETVIQNLKDIPSAKEWKDECDRAYTTGWIRGMESVDCNTCEQRSRCDRGRAVDCPLHEKERTMRWHTKEYTLKNGKTIVFEYDDNEIGRITLECMDKLMDIVNKAESFISKKEGADDV